MIKTTVFVSTPRMPMTTMIGIAISNTEITKTTRNNRSGNTFRVMSNLLTTSGQGFSLADIVSPPLFKVALAVETADSTQGKALRRNDVPAVNALLAWPGAVGILNLLGLALEPRSGDGRCVARVLELAGLIEYVCCHKAALNSFNAAAIR